MRRKKSKFTKAELLNRAIEAWEKRQEGAVLMLRKSAEMLVKLRRQRRRMLERDTKQAVAKPSNPADPLAAWPVPPPADYRPDEDIPTFLDRTGEEKDAAARAEIAAEQATQKKRKAERRIAKLKIGQETKHAELTGQRRKMPLSGKAALAAIDGK
jgi:hypothetical protein